MQNNNVNIIFCSKCGQKNETKNSFCAGCGSKLGSITTHQTNHISKNESISYLNTYEMDLFLEKNQMYYHEKFERMSITGDKKSWNWAAFFLNIYWMLYRKMYLQAGVVYLLNLIIAFIPHIGWILSLAFGICIGLYSNSLYFNHINKNLREIDQLYPNNKEIMIMKKGRTNLPLAITVGVILNILAFIISFMTTFAMTQSLFY